MAGFCFFVASLTWPGWSRAQEAIEEITITSTRTHRSFDDQPSRIVVLDDEELSERANMRPGDIRMLLNESTGIHVQQTSATSFNSSVRIQGLDGRYTQILRDGMPLYGGFSGGLSLLQIAPLDLQRVEVIKGASSTLYGAGAIAGMVNLITKTPGAEPERSILLNTTSAGGIDVSGFYSGTQGSVGSTVFGSYNRSDAYDPADIGLSAIPQFERWTLNPRLFVAGNTSRLTLGLNAVVEDRLGGDMRHIRGRRDGPAYYEDSSTKRISSQLEYLQQLASGNELVLRNSVSHFRRDLTVPSWQFFATQVSSFSEAHLLGSVNTADWVAGLNLWTEDFNHHGATQGFQHDFNSHTLGSFAQLTLPIAEQLTLESGLRLDYTSDYGSFLLPRVSLLYRLSPQTTVRVGGGMGYMAPTLFTEEAETQLYRDLLPLDMNLLKAERSAGLNLDVNRMFALGEVLGEELTLNLNVLLFYTRVDDPLRLVPLDSGPQAFRQPIDYLDTRGTEVNAAWRWDDVKFYMGYTHTDVQEHRATESGKASLIPEDRVNLVLMYERDDDILVGLEAFYYSSQRLKDGSRSRSYWIVGLMAEKMFGDGFSVFLNFENFTDTRQTRYGPIYSGAISEPVFNDLYAPLDGFVINGGIKWRF